MRILHETESWENYMFVTLTYSDQYLPFDVNSLYPTLRKDHLVKFYKRLRKSIEPFKIKYFACGEYGEQNLRPHYHMILFGLGLQDKDLIKEAWPFCDWSIPAIDEKSFGLAEIKSIEYVAQYIDKKLSGQEADEEYGHKMREPVFKINSLGMGKEFALKNKAQLQQDLSVSMWGTTHALPRYYIDKCKIDIKKAKERAKTLEKIENEKLGGVRLSETQIYKKGDIKILNKINKKKSQNRSQKDTNLKAKISLKKLRTI